MEASEQRRIIEALILTAGDPISAARLAEIVPGCTPGVAKDRVNELNTEYQEQDRSFEIWEVAGGYQIRTRAEFSGYLQQLRKERPLRLSRAALETLAIVAYKQPVTRGDVELVRGVDAGAVMKGLLDRKLVKMLGHKEVPGRPMLYGTSRRFLEVFGLESLDRLPNLRELEEIAREQEIELPGGESTRAPDEAGSAERSDDPAGEGGALDDAGAEFDVTAELQGDGATPGEAPDETIHRAGDGAFEGPEIVEPAPLGAPSPGAEVSGATGSSAESEAFPDAGSPREGGGPFEDRYAPIEVPPVDGAEDGPAHEGLRHEHHDEPEGIADGDLDDDTGPDRIV